uniref:hypothetical protein n=1 Tax=Promicromonospora sp. CA-291202 TaxID=3240016 RepID=UPI003F4926E3
MIPMVVTPLYLASVSWPEGAEFHSDIPISAGTVTLRDAFTPMIQANLVVPYSDVYWAALDPGHAPILHLDLTVPQYPLALQFQVFKLIVRQVTRVKASDTINIRAESYDAMLAGRVMTGPFSTTQATIFDEIQDLLDAYYVTERDSVVVSRDPVTLATGDPVAVRPTGSSFTDIIEANIATTGSIGIWRPNGNLLLQSSSVYQTGATDAHLFVAYDPGISDFIPLLSWEWDRSLDSGYADFIRLAWEDGSVLSTTVPIADAIVVQRVDFEGSMPPGYVPAAGTANSILARMRARKERIQVTIPLMPNAQPYDGLALPIGWPEIEPGAVSGQWHIIREVTHDLVNATTTLTIS